MNQERNRTLVRVDAYTRACMTVIAALLAVLVLGLWTEGQWTANPAAAAPSEDGFGDSAAQRKAMVAAQEDANEKLAELLKLLRSGEVKVQVVSTEPKGVGGADAPTSKSK